MKNDIYKLLTLIENVILQNDPVIFCFKWAELVTLSPYRKICCLLWLLWKEKKLFIGTTFLIWTLSISTNTIMLRFSNKEELWSFIKTKRRFIFHFPNYFFKCFHVCSILLRDLWKYQFFYEIGTFSTFQDLLMRRSFLSDV